MIAEHDDLGKEEYGDSLAIVYNAENQEISIESYRINYEWTDWVITEIVTNMQYDSEGELISFDWDVYEYLDDSIVVLKQKLQNLLWYGGYDFHFFSEIFADENVLREVFHESYLPIVYQGHLLGPIQSENYSFLDGEWQFTGETIVDSLSQTFISAVSTLGSEHIRLQLTLNEDSQILTEKFFIEDEDPVFLFGYEYGYSEFGLQLFERDLFTVDGSLYDEYFTAEYEVDDNNRLLFFEYESRGNFREKGEYFYNSGVSVSSAQLQNDAVKLFPNPVENKMTIQLELEINKPMQYQILSTDGRALMSGVFEANTQNEINVSNLPSGLYFFKWQMAEKYGSQRIVKL